MDLSHVPFGFPSFTSIEIVSLILRMCMTPNVATGDIGELLMDVKVIIFLNVLHFAEGGDLKAHNEDTRAMSTVHTAWFLDETECSTNTPYYNARW